MIVNFDEILYSSLWEFFEESKENQKDIQKIYEISDKDMEEIINENDFGLLLDLTDSDTEVIEKVFDYRPGKYIVEYLEDDELIRVMIFGE